MLPLGLGQDPEGRLKLFGDDAAALVEIIEDSFGVRFSSIDLAEATTIGKLSARLSEKLPTRPSERCLTANGFYLLRRTLSSVYEIPRERITPTTPLRDLLPWPSRAARWRELQKDTTLRLPTLTIGFWPLVISTIATVVTLTLPVFGRNSLAALTGSVSSVFTCIAGFALWAVCVRVAIFCFGNFPSGCATIGDLVKLIVARNYKKFATAHGRSSESEQLALLRQLIAAEGGIRVERISVHTRFPEGLRVY